MSANALRAAPPAPGPPPADVLTVEKRTVVEAWAMLERLVVSLRAIGSHHAAPAGEPLAADRRAAMLAALDQLFDAGTFAEMARVRRSLGDLLPDDEAEAISEGLNYWLPPDEPADAPAKH
jgi:hypothetical protein